MTCRHGSAKNSKRAPQLHGRPIPGPTDKSRGCQGPSQYAGWDADTLGAVERERCDSSPKTGHLNRWMVKVSHYPGRPAHEMLQVSRQTAVLDAVSVARMPDLQQRGG